MKKHLGSSWFVDFFVRNNQLFSCASQSRNISYLIYIIMEQQKKDKDVVSMRKQQLTYHFHNPNPERALEDYIQKIIITNGVRDIFAILQKQEQQVEQTTGNFANGGMI